MRLPLWPPMHVVGFRGDLRRVARRDNLSIILRMRTSSQWLAHTFFATTLPERVTALSLPRPSKTLYPMPTSTRVHHALCVGATTAPASGPCQSACDIILTNITAEAISVRSFEVA